MNDWLMDEVDRKYHEASQIFPLMQGDEFEELKDDIVASGLLEAIWLHPDSSIIDGRNRHRACIETETEPRFRIWNNDGSLVSFIMSMNLHRRHLNETQRAMVAAKMANMQQGRQETNGSIDLFSQPEAAKELNVSVPSIKRAKQVLEHGIPELIAVVDQGQATVSSAAKIAEMPETEQAMFVDRVKAGEKSAKVLRDIQRQRQRKEVETTLNNVIEFAETTDNYCTIVIDPPWPVKKILRDVRPNQDVMDYPTMTIEEIARLPIRDLADEKGCHVYLWTTHKFLPNALQLFEGWDVKYQCLMTWVKNVGFTPFSWMYSTEHVLFGRIGSLQLTCKGLRLDFSGKVREHSRKPDEFYNRIIQASPGPRIDLFSRENREGFDQWGREIDKFAKGR